MRGSVAVVQLVTAAMASAPCVSAWTSPASSSSTVLPRSSSRSSHTARKRSCTPSSGMRSCGLEGPASERPTELRSSSITSAYLRAGASGSFQNPCAFAYASTSATCSSLRPVRRRYASVASSTGNSVQVLPYSGVMFEMHVRCVAFRLARPGPKHSTNEPTTPFSRSIWANVSATSMAATPSASSPVRRTPTTRGTSVVMGWPSAAASASMPPTPQPSTPMPFAVGVWLSVPTSVSKYATGRSPSARATPASSDVMTTCANCSMFS